MRDNLLLTVIWLLMATYSGFGLSAQNTHQTCGFSLKKRLMTEAERAMVPTSCSEATSQGYGSSCVNSDSTIPALPFPACGKFRVPIAFRQIANNDCTGVLPDMNTRLDQELCYLNQMFGPANIEFFECSRPTAICDTDLVNFDGDTEETAINANNIPNVINIYLPTTVTLGGSSIGGYAPLGGSSSEPSFFVAAGTAGNEQIGQYTYSDTGCTTNNSACSPTGNHWTLLAHEMGHYFGLNHTFETDLNGAGAGSTTELADGSNSCTAGDLHEDTAPDPYQQLADAGVDTDAQSDCSNSCTWTNPGGTNDVQDANGNSYGNLAANNIMSYWNYDCTSTFSPFQTRRMYDVLQNCATYLCCNNADNYLADVAQQNITVCEGDALPEIVGDLGRCYSWYADATTTTAISSGTTNLSSADFATAVNTSIAGTYTIYVQNANSVANASASLASCRIPITVTVNAGGTNGCALTCSGVGTGLNIQLKAMLEGFIQSNNTMRTDLNNNSLLPNNQPFATNPWNYSGSENVVSFPTDVVDWVLVRAYDTNKNKLEEQACLINTNGDLKNACDFTSSIQFTNSAASISYISLHQKSHLAVIAQVNGNSIIDFTIAGTAIGVQQTKVVQGINALYCGDYDGNGIVNNLDYNVWITNNSVVNSYVNQDGDGNAIINNLDYNLWENNRSKVGESTIQL